jgi:hypothetical protein
MYRRQRKFSMGRLPVSQVRTIGAILPAMLHSTMLCLRRQPDLDLYSWQVHADRVMLVMEGGIQLRL